MKVGNLVVYDPPSKVAGVGIIGAVNPYFYFIYWSGFPDTPMVAIKKSAVRLANKKVLDNQ